MGKYRRTDEVCIDIRAKSVRVVRTNAAGKIVRVGVAPLPDDMLDIYEPLYPVRLARAVRAAAGAARAGKLCRSVLVTGGPEIIIRRFTWPDLPPKALHDNAQSEMIPYLPGDGEGYTVGCRVLRRAGTQAEVMVAAIPKGAVSVLLEACRRAGFNPGRVDVRENAREKLARDPSLWKLSDFDPGGSFAFLDMTEAPYSLTVFINGNFYVNRYFGGGGISAEIASVLDYIHYRERGVKVAGILVCGEAEGLDDTGVPIFRAPDCVNLPLPRHTDLSTCLDGYGASVRINGDIDLTPRKESKRIFKRFVLPSFCTAAAISGLITLGVYFQGRQIESLKADIESLDRELARYGVSSGRETDLLSDVHEFRTRYPDARMIIQHVNDSLTPGSSVGSLTLGEGDIKLEILTDEAGKAAELFESLRAKGLRIDTGSVTYRGGVLNFSGQWMEGSYEKA